MIGKMDIATALGNRWPLHFFPETDFIYNDLHMIQKWTETERAKLKTFQDTSGHRILPSCDCKVRETMVAKFELLL